MTRRTNQAGAVSTWMITAICLIIVAVITSGATVWAMMSYFNEKNTVDTQVDAAVATAKKTQADTDAADYDELAKKPTVQFTGPDDYGRVTFQYPKTWSVYTDKAGTSNGDTFQAYLNPVAVPPVSDSTQYALRVTIEQTDYDKVISSYSSLVQKGTLTSSAVTVGGEGGTRLDGNFTKDIRGSAVIFKIRDKTVTIRTDADTFDSDFNTLITTIKFNS